MNQWKRTLDLLKAVYNSFAGENAPKSAAAMAYYTLFSLFPLLIVLVTVISYFVNPEEASRQVSQLLMEVIPVSHNLVDRNIQRVLEVRNSVGIAGLIGFVWSSSSAFYIMVDNINRAWEKDQRRSFFEKRLFGLAIVILLIVVLILFMTGSSMLDILLASSPGVGIDFWSYLSEAVNWFSVWLFFISLYRFVPSGDAPWKIILPVSLGVTAVWRGAAILFRWYLRSGFSRYELVFGSLSAIVVLLFWIYISSVIIFFGAHLTAELTRRHRS
jgi:membrane protein